MGYSIKHCIQLKVFFFILGTIFVVSNLSALGCDLLFNKEVSHEELVGVVETNKTLGNSLPAKVQARAQKRLDTLVKAVEAKEKADTLMQRFGKVFKDIRVGLPAILKIGIGKMLAYKAGAEYTHLLGNHLRQRLDAGDHKKPVIFVVFDTETTGFQKEHTEERNADVLTEIAAQAFDQDFKKIEHSAKSKKLKDVETLFEGWAKLEDDFIVPKYKIAQSMLRLEKSKLKVSEAKFFNAIHKAFSADTNVNAKLLAAEMYESFGFKTYGKNFSEFESIVKDVVEAYRYAFVFHLTAFHKVPPEKRNLSEAELLKRFDKYLKDLDEHYNVILVAHNYRFDYGMILSAAKRSSGGRHYIVDNPHWVDVMVIAKQVLDMYQLLRATYEEELYRQTASYRHDEPMSKTQINKFLNLLPFRHHSTRELAHLFGIKTDGHHQAFVDIAISANVQSHLYALEVKLQKFITDKAKGTAVERRAIYKAVEAVRGFQITDVVVDREQTMTTSFRAPYYERHRSLLKRLLSFEGQGRRSTYKLSDPVHEYIFGQTPSSGRIFDSKLPDSSLMGIGIEI